MGLTMLLAGSLYGAFQGVSYLGMMVLSVVGLVLTLWVAYRPDFASPES